MAERIAVSFPDTRITGEMTINLPDASEVDVDLGAWDYRDFIELGKQIKLAIDSARMMRNQTPTSLLLTLTISEP